MFMWPWGPLSTSCLAILRSIVQGTPDIIIFVGFALRSVAGSSAEIVRVPQFRTTSLRCLKGLKLGLRGTYRSVVLQPLIPYAQS